MIRDADFCERCVMMRLMINELLLHVTCQTSSSFLNLIDSLTDSI